MYAPIHIQHASLYMRTLSLQGRVGGTQLRNSADTLVRRAGEATVYLQNSGSKGIQGLASSQQHNQECRHF